MKITIESYGLSNETTLPDDSDIWEVMNAVSGGLQVVGFLKETIDSAIRREEESLWLAPTQSNLEKWADSDCLYEAHYDSDSSVSFVAQYKEMSTTDRDRIIRFIPIENLCG